MTNVGGATNTQEAQSRNMKKICTKYGFDISKLYLRYQVQDLTFCIVKNGEKIQSYAMTLTLIGQCPVSNSSELFPYTCTAICSSFKWTDQLFLTYRVHR